MAKNKLTKMAVIVGLGLSLSACTNEEQGSFWGAIVGGLVGSAVAEGEDNDFGVMLGAAIGAEVGASYGRKLDRLDRIEQQRAYRYAMEEGRNNERYTWENPESGNSGYFEPEPAYQNPYNQYCREFTQEVTIGGESQTAYGTACRQPDGSWKITEK